MSQPTDYTTWQHAELICRIQQLERDLQLNTKSLAELSAKESAKKPPRPFDATKHSTRKIALKFAYFGASYNGLEHHNRNVTSLPAVEKVLWQALVKTKLISPEPQEGQSEDDICWDGCEYSKCGRTDKGVSSFGQVIGIRIRSARPLPKSKAIADDVTDGEPTQAGSDQAELEEQSFDPIKDELPYIFMLNRLLPPDIRILAWCPDPPPDFDARFSCRERRYRYFFSNPAFLPVPGKNDHGERWLNIDAMRVAAKKYEGVHDFRNFCKIDGAKQITSFDRRIFSSTIHAVEGDEAANPDEGILTAPKLYYFEVRGSAFLWHQVRHLVAVLFLVGQGLEQPGVIDELMDVRRTPARPAYLMASDAPLVLWECIFPDLSQAGSDHTADDGLGNVNGYTDSLQWVYANDETLPRTKLHPISSNDRRYDREGILEGLWSQWRRWKLKEVLTQQLMHKVAKSGSQLASERYEPSLTAKGGTRVFEGGDDLRTVGVYTPLMQRKCAERPEIVNARYAAKKGLRPRESESATSAG